MSQRRRRLSHRCLMLILVPCEELGNRVRRENSRAIAISDTLDIRLQILVGNNRNLGFERVPICGSVEVESSKILRLRISTKYLTQNPLLDGISVPGHLVNELESFGVSLACRWAEWGRES